MSYLHSQKKRKKLEKYFRAINKTQKSNKPNLSTLFKERGHIKSPPPPKKNAQSNKHVRFLGLLTRLKARFGFTVYMWGGRGWHELSHNPSHWVWHSGRAPSLSLYKASHVSSVNFRLQLMVSFTALETTLNAAAQYTTHVDVHPHFVASYSNYSLR